MDDRKAANNRANIRVAAFGATIALSMVGAAYAAVPLYQLFCQVTGYGGTTQRTDTYSDRVLDRKITVRFDSNTVGVPWEFRPKQRSVSMKIGETTQISYFAHNRSKRTSTASATFNVSPSLAGAYFNKVECFCFTETTLKPGESLDMPVVFYIDPDIIDQPELKDIRTITLSYTFFPVDAEGSPVASAPVDSTTKTNSTQE
ncbi:cytochrome c oxidase assembly protein [Zhengella mangrovi]|uniref:Cytochrome c oxidase assembly protein CtaG n=1 Tax=Zhengella mangrovi TaxID=1982044 RepID=A0A2G1QNK0_9HYPH|nr:cytochrome c oxidase assembly protein [Zhengella mangrovi]PHP67127.1 cytochrome c oxidase assembly protein [Zhengella mangrovi]